MENKLHLIFTYGPPCAGKTTFAKHWVQEHDNWFYIGADALRKAMYGSEDIYGNGELIYQCLLEAINYNLARGRNVIYDATNLRKDYRLDFLNNITSECKKEIYIFNVEERVAMKRHKNRHRSIPWSDLSKYFHMKEEYPVIDEGWDDIKVF